VRLQIVSVHYVMVTDGAGRFKINLAKEVEPAQVTRIFTKPGYGQVHATKRRPPKKTLSPVQAGRVLEPKRAAVK